MLDENTPEHEKQKWKVFVLLDKKKDKRQGLKTISLELKKGSEVLYQVFLMHKDYNIIMM